MKKLLALAVLVFSALSLTAQDETSGPAITFETTTVDYGTIAKNSDPYRVFEFTNTGDAPLIIKSAKGSCGCTVPEYPKDPIMPGETNEVKVRYDTKRVGSFSKSVTLTTNASDENIVLRIKGKVNAEAEKSVPEPEKEGAF